MARDTETGIAGWNADRNSGSRGRRVKDDRRRRVAALVALCVLCVACVVCAWTPKDTIARGLWLKGGTAVTMTVEDADAGEATPEALSQAAATIRKRLEIVGVSDSRVAVKGSDAIVIELPWNVDAEAIAQAVGGAGNIEFVRVDRIGDADALAKVNAGTSDVALDKDTYTSFISGDSVESATVTEVSSGVYAITFMFDDEAEQSFADVTRELAENTGRIAIVVDGRVVSAPSVSEEITGGQVSISGDFSEEEANALKALVDTDALPVNLVMSGSESVGPLVGKAGLWALVALAYAALLASIVIGYVRLKRLAVLVAGTFVVFACTILGCMALFSRFDMFVLTLPGIAGGIWTGAVALFTAWLIARRFQAMVRGGMSVKGAATTAVGEGISPVKLPCALAFVLSCVFLFLPFRGLHDLGVTVIMGTVCGLAAVLGYAAVLLRLLAMGAIQADPVAWGVDNG